MSIGSICDDYMTIITNMKSVAEDATTTSSTMQSYIDSLAADESSLDTLIVTNPTLTLADTVKLMVVTRIRMDYACCISACIKLWNAKQVSINAKILAQNSGFTFPSNPDCSYVDPGNSFDSSIPTDITDRDAVRDIINNLLTTNLYCVDRQDLIKWCSNQL